MINVIVSSDSSQRSLALSKALELAGASSMVVHPGDPLPEDFDALVLAGGADVSPARYRARARFSDLTLAPGRDEQDFALFEQSQRSGAAVLGICRGAQVINVALGGTLWQDLPEERAGGVAHNFDHTRGFAPSHGAHAVIASPRAQKGGGLGGLFRSSRSFIVNSRHHQAVRRLAPDLISVAVAPDGLVEAFQRKGAPFCGGVQWHPEDLLDEPVHRSIFALFVRSASNARMREAA